MTLQEFINNYAELTEKNYKHLIDSFDGSNEQYRNGQIWEANIKRNQAYTLMYHIEQYIEHGEISDSAILDLM